MNIKEGSVESEGHQLAYLAVNEHRAHGDEPVIVFIHGVLASVNFWLDCLPPEFNKERAWYSLSLPAHHPSTVPKNFKPGDVDKDWLYQIILGALNKLLCARKAIVVGHSTGGFCALNLASHQPANLAGVVSVAGFHQGSWGGVEGWLLKLAGAGKWARGLFKANIRLSQSSAFVRRTFTGLLAHDHKTFRSNPLTRRMLENIETNTLLQDSDALSVLFNGIAGVDIADQLHRITVPCHIFSGTHDPVVPAEQSDLLAREIPGARAVAFQNVGHMPFIEDSDAFFDALRRALEDINADNALKQLRKQGTADDLS